jgi:hypothetical protein
MKPRDSQAKSLQENLFQARLDQQLNPKHPLFRLAQQIEKLSEDDAMISVTLATDMIILLDYD